MQQNFLYKIYMNSFSILNDGCEKFLANKCSIIIFNCKKEFGWVKNICQKLSKLTSMDKKMENIGFVKIGLV